MELLKNRILTDGRALNEQVLLVDSFLNHQVDPELMEQVGEEFAARFADAKVDRVVTIESSGIAPALMTALKLHVPMVIMKKSMSSILQEDILQTEVFSFTKNTPYQLTLKRKFVHPGDRVLIIDDFLANGAALNGLIKLVSDAKAELVGAGIVIEKAFQPGGDLIRGRRSTPSRIREAFITPTLSATPGDLSLVLPKRILDGIIEMIYALDKVAPGTANDDTLLYGVEVKFYNMEVAVNERLQTRYNGLYIIGDGSGITHSLSHASASGVHVARAIAEN